MYQQILQNYNKLYTDTQTIPSKTMLNQMQQTIVGDDSYNEDPTTIKLQNTMKQLFQKEAALFMPTTTMSNTVALQLGLLNKKEQNIFINKLSHLYTVEKPGIEWIFPQANIQTFKYNKQIKQQIDKNEGILCIENPTFEGQILDNSYLEDLHTFKIKNPQIHIHLDGARIFDWLTVSNREILKKEQQTGYQLINNLDENQRNIFKIFDTISICFSKGLCCPLGSILIGSEQLIKQGFKYRKFLGGALRQSGYISGMALQSLEEIVPQLQKSHELCQQTFNYLKKQNINQIIIFKHLPQINMLFVGVKGKNGQQLSNVLKDQYGILCKPCKENIYVRACFTIQQDQQIVQQFCEAIIEISENIEQKNMGKL